MSRISIPAIQDLPADSQPLLDAVQAQLGVTPNLFRLVGISPNALEGLLGLSGALGRTLDVRTRERIALTVAQITGCDYCLSAHSYLALNMAGLDEAEVRANRQGHSNDPRADAIVRFARRVVETRGKVEDEAIASARAAGITDATIIEIVANVAINVFTNLINNVAQTEIDFPVVSAVAA